MKTTIETQQMAEIGRISCMLLHDVINPVNGLTLLMENINNLYKIPIQDRDEIIESVQKSGRAVRAFIRNLQDFINQKTEKQIVSLEKIISNILDIYKVKTLRNGTQIILIRKTIKDLVVAEPLLLYQVFMNLISNALDSFEDIEPNRKRKLTIAIEETGDLNKKLQIKISDNGSGISAQIMNQIFKIGFTTKRTGNGVGLYGVKEIVENNLCGQIRVESQIGVGSDFYILLPKEMRILHERD